MKGDMNEDDKALTKMGLRRLILGQLRELSPAEKASRSQQISEHLYQFLGLKSGQFVAFFAGVASEPDLMTLCERYWQEGVRVALLAIDADTHQMQAYEVRSAEDLFLGAFRVMEPKRLPEAKVPLSAFEALLIPGVGFHPMSGMRLGRGKGHYDRYLADAAHLLKVGVCFELQLNGAIVGEDHDIPMTHLACESGVKAI